MTPNMLGAYGEWAAPMMQDQARLSLRLPMFGNVDAWRRPYPNATRFSAGLELSLASLRPL